MTNEHSPPGMGTRYFAEVDMPTAEEVTEFLARFERACWVCEKGPWIIQTINDTPTLVFHQTMERKNMLVIPCFALVCQTCANLWLVSFEQFEIATGRAPERNLVPVTKEVES